MPVWLDEAQTLLYMTLQGSISADEFRALVDESARMQGTVRHTVHVLLDVGDLQIAGEVRVFASLRYLEKHTPRNQGLLIALGATPLLYSLGVLARRIIPRATYNLYFADSLDEAKRIVQEKG